MTSQAVGYCLVMKVTNEQIKRAQTDWNRIAKEVGTVELIADTLYFWGSEIATLRLMVAFHMSETVRVGTRQNDGVNHFFSVRLPA